MIKKMILLSIISMNFMYGDDCERQDSDMTKALDIFRDAESKFSDGEYKDAYDLTIKSIGVYGNDLKSISLTYNCTHYIPSSYIPEIKQYSETREEAFDRFPFATLMKKYLNPNPYIVIQQTDKKTIVTVANVKKTARADVVGQLSLEEVKVTLGSETLSFPTIESNLQATQEIGRALDIKQATISMTEKVSIQLFKKD